LSKNSQPITGRFATAFANYRFANSQFADYPRPTVYAMHMCVTQPIQCFSTIQRTGNVPVQVFPFHMLDTDGTGRLAIFTVPSGP